MAMASSCCRPAYRNKLRNRCALVDLAEVTFASSALPNFVVRLSQAVPHGAELILWRAPPMTGRVLRLTDMATIATLRDDPTVPYGVPA